MNAVKFSAEFSEVGPGWGGHVQPYFTFRFSGKVSRPEYSDVIGAKYVEWEYDDKLSPFNHFYQGVSEYWLLIEFWNCRDRRDKLDALKVLFDEIVADFKSLGLEQTDPESVIKLTGC